VSPLRSALAPAAVLALSACLLLYGLERPKLWVDEAETALLGRSILVYGVPKARLGKDLISQEISNEFGPDYLWRWTPWLDKYVAAGSFALLGEGTLSARLPFALLGLATVGSMYALGMGVFGDRRIALLSMLFLGTSVPFLLHARQCRYYVLAILGTLWAVHWAVACVRRPGLRAPLGLAASLTLVFHANYLGFAALGFALAATLWILGSERAGWLRLLLAGAVVAALNGPWLLYFDVAGKSTRYGAFHPDFLPDYLALVTHYGFPVPALAVFGALAVATAQSRKRFRELCSEWRLIAFLALIPVFYLPVICFAPLRFFRYAANLLPVCAVLLAWLSVRAGSLHPIGGRVLTALLLVTGVFGELAALPTRYGGNYAPGRTSRVLDWVFPLGNFLAELAHPYETSMGRITEYLAVNARPGDRVYVSYGDLVTRFYLPQLETRGGQSGESLDGWGPPEWVVVRRFFRFIIPKIPGSDAQSVMDWLKRLPWNEYQTFELLQPDLAWESIPEPEFHYYYPPPAAGAKPVSIARRTPAPY
jgi:hypothetical protein